MSEYPFDPRDRHDLDLINHRTNPPRRTTMPNYHPLTAEVPSSPEQQIALGLMPEALRRLDLMITDVVSHTSLWTSEWYTLNVTVQLTSTPVVAVRRVIALAETVAADIVVDALESGTQVKVHIGDVVGRFNTHIPVVSVTFSAWDVKLAKYLANDLEGLSGLQLQEYEALAQAARPYIADIAE
jgi:hypothetical protein